MEKTCQYCHKEFSTRTNMIAHQKKTLSCLEIQNELNKKEKTDKNKCSGCNMVLSSITSLKRHKLKCLEYQLEQQKNKMEKEFEDKEKIYKDMITDLKKQIKELSKDNNQLIQNIHSRSLQTVENVAIKSKPNNTIIQNNINNLPPYTDEWVEDKIQYMNKSHIQDYKSLSLYIANVVMTNVRSIDRPRKKICYKNNELKIIKGEEKELHTLIIKSLEILIPKINDLMKILEIDYNNPVFQTKYYDIKLFVCRLNQISQDRLGRDEAAVLNKLINSVNKYLQKIDQGNNEILNIENNTLPAIEYPKDELSDEETINMNEKNDDEDDDSSVFDSNYSNYSNKEPSENAIEEARLEKERIKKVKTEKIRYTIMRNKIRDLLRSFRVKVSKNTIIPYKVEGLDIDKLSEELNAKAECMTEYGLFNIEKINHYFTKRNDYFDEDEYDDIMKRCRELNGEDSEMSE